MSRARKLLRRLRRNISGLAMTEFALSMPFLMVGGLWGVETANFAVVNMRVSQLATHMADNASRIGDTSTVSDRRIYEGDIGDLFQGAAIQGGKLAFFDHGRAIISSLETDPGNEPEQYIHWQRCMGAKVWNSSYGVQGDTMAAMGPPGRQVYAFNDDAVMFVEVAYDYQPLVSTRFIGSPVIRAIASFTVRDDRDLSQIYQRNPGAPDPVAECAVYDNPTSTLPPGAGGGSSSSSSGSSGGSSSGGSSSSSSGSSGSSSSGGSSSSSGGSSGGSSSGGSSSSSGETSSGGGAVSGASAPSGLRSISGSS